MWHHVQRNFSILDGFAADRCRLKSYLGSVPWLYMWHYHRSLKFTLSNKQQEASLLIKSINTIINIDIKSIDLLHEGVTNI